jgi:hydroxyacylglutathione hydrolase
VFADEGIAFVGDNFFAMGCGRWFEGSPEQMHQSLRRLAALPPETKLYCAHEYTLSNARFAAHVEPDNPAIAARLEKTQAQRAAGQRTVPMTVADEIATNPFVRASGVEQFASLRAQKDVFG